MTMKSHALRNLQFVTGNVRLAFLLWLAVAICFASVPVFAQGSSWQVDAEHSIARLSVGSGSDAVEIGVARVSGEVVFDSSDPVNPVVTLNVSSDKGAPADHRQLSFTSTGSARTTDGRLVVTGNLSVTGVERSVTIEPNEAYAGPVYGEPTAHTDTREITLMFSDPRQSVLPSGQMELSASTTLSRETFPQLLDALTPGAWPTMLANNETCRVPSTIGEDYSGPICTGEVVTTVTNDERITGTAGGEDYRGFEPSVAPKSNQAIIALNLKLTPLAPTATAASVNAESAGH
jgi:polyisoprenoid-binding protein YceI